MTLARRKTPFANENPNPAPARCAPAIAVVPPSAARAAAESPGGLADPARPAARREASVEGASREWREGDYVSWSPTSRDRERSVWPVAYVVESDRRSRSVTVECYSIDPETRDFARIALTKAWGEVGCATEGERTLFKMVDTLVAAALQAVSSFAPCGGTADGRVG